MNDLYIQDGLRHLVHGFNRLSTGLEVTLSDD